MDDERCVFPVLYTLTSPPANKVSPNRLPLLFLHYNSKTCQLPPSRDVPRHFLCLYCVCVCVCVCVCGGGGGGVFSI